MYNILHISVKLICKGKGGIHKMKTIKKYLNRIFIEGLSGMALGLFATLIIGTILEQISKMIPGAIGDYLYVISRFACVITGAGIGVGVAYKFKESPLVVISSATAGMVGAFASKIIAGDILADKTLSMLSPGEPLGAFVAAYVAIEVGHLVSGKTKIDIIVTPFTSILAGSTVGLILGPPISDMMKSLGSLINWGTEQQPFVMGIVVSVLMGMILTLPISSAALSISLQLTGIAAGAATVGCCANMIGFAVASYRENKMGGFFAQGIGTSMLQVPNIVRKPVIWLPAIISSAILGPVSTMLLHMTNNPSGGGMGTSGLVGQINTYIDMTVNESGAVVIIKILVLHFILPGIIALGCSEFMRKKGIIKENDMKLEL